MTRILLTYFAVPFLVFSAINLSASPIPAQLDIEGADTARYLVRIERAEVTPLNVAETLDVTIQTFGWPYAACALKIGTNSKFVDIIDIQRGEIIDSCRWEYFKATRLKTDNKPQYPRSLWSVVALAKFTPDTTKPPCLGLNREASFMRLVVTSAPTVAIRDSTASIFFFWEDCRDNTLSDATGATLLVSKQIFDYFDTREPGTGRAFPTRNGTPDACINSQMVRHPERRIEFHNGGLKFVVEQKKPDRGQSPTKTN